MSGQKKGDPEPDLNDRLRDRICKKCDFYKEGEKLECHAFKVSRKLVKEGRVNLDEL